MGLLGNLVKATVKVALTPVAIVADVVDVANGETPLNTINNLNSAAEDVAEGIDELL